MLSVLKICHTRTAGSQTCTFTAVERTIDYVQMDRGDLEHLWSD